MIKIYKNYKTEEILSRKIDDYGEYEEVVKGIIADVAKCGDEAVKKYCLKFDGFMADSLEVTAAEFDEAESALTDDYKAVIRASAANIAEFHKKQLKQGFEIKKQGGIVLGQKYTAVARAGVYVPGGTASYPSTVLMDTIPAKIAGVGEIIMVTPVKADGRVRPEILYAARVAGADRVFKVGGAQAIAALAYGTQTIPKADVIVGPGNIFVALAKKLVYGLVNVDMIAGPSEILVIADAKSNPVFVAADMLSQAEHDKLASAVLVTESEQLALAVQGEIERQLALMPREEIARASIENNGKIIVCESIQRAVDIANQIAPEHLEVCVDDPMALLPSIKNAGSIFLGRYTPEALGDYYAGPNHTLPTGGSAKYSSPLSVDDFLKKSSYIMYTKDGLEEAADCVIKFAESEGLYGHANSVKVRTIKA